MKTKILIAILLITSITIANAQNEIINREAFTLKLPVDGEQFYEQEVKSTPYFVKENILQIYPGEKLYVEVKLNKNKIATMTVVKENLNPKRTLEIEFTQSTKDRKSELMMLKVTNPFETKLKYNAMMYLVGHDQWVKTSIIPVYPKMVGFETWKDVIITLVLTDWELE